MGSLIVNNLSFAYQPGMSVLENINLRVESGERIGILGASGAGKTTLLLNLAGILSGRGEIYLNGENLSEKREQLTEKIALAMQNPEDQLFSPTVFEELAFGLRRQKKKEEEIIQQVQEIASLFGIAELLDQSIFKLSFGQKRKIALAAVLITGPEIIALDEPFAGLDYASLKKLMTILEKLKVTQIIVSQDVLFTATICQRLIFLKNKTIQADLLTSQIDLQHPIWKKFDPDFEFYFQQLYRFWLKCN